MSKHVIQSDRGAPPQGAYSQGWRAGDFIFVTGTGPIDPVMGKLVGDDIERQAEQTIDNIEAILAADGASLGDVVKVTVHLSDTGLFARYNAVYARRFAKPYPVRTTVGSDLGHSPGMLIEIDCIAYMEEKKAARTAAPKAKKKARRRK
jgi:2-iminobutanoate/2-iminopropanoate deaminase